MKRVLLFLSLFFFLAGCQKSATVTPIAEPVATADTSAEEEDSDNQLVRYNLIIRDQNFGVDEMFVQKGQPLIISLRNQIDEPVNITIDGLPIHTKNVEKGEIVEVEIPTTIPGEFEVYSSVGNQRSEGFSTLLTIEE